MKTLIKILLICLIAISPLLLSWTGSEATIEIVNPSGELDNSELNIPVKLDVKQFNNIQGIAYAVYYLLDDILADSVISSDDYATMREVARIDKINIERAFTATWLKTDNLEQEKYYFVVGVGVDLNGETSCDTTLLEGETYAGGGASGIQNVAIARFKTGGLR